MGRQSLKAVSRLIDLANKEVSVEEQFLNDLKRSIVLQDKKGWRIPSKTFKPSGMQCQRASYFQLIGAKPDDSDGTYNFIGICNAGTDIHERTQLAVSQMHENDFNCAFVDVKKYVEEQHKKGSLKDIDVVEQKGFETKLYNKKYNISFMCDGIIRYKGKYYILEIKTEMSGKWYNRDGVDSKHYNQATAYSLSLNLSDVIFLYISRDNLEMKSFMFHVTSDMRQQIIDYIENVNDYVKKKVVPPKIDEKRICNYCGYQMMCKKEK